MMFGKKVEMKKKIIKKQAKRIKYLGYVLNSSTSDKRKIKTVVKKRTRFYEVSEV